MRVRRGRPRGGSAPALSRPMSATSSVGGWAGSVGFREDHMVAVEGSWWGLMRVPLAW